MSEKTGPRNFFFFFTLVIFGHRLETSGRSIAEIPFARLAAAIILVSVPARSHPSLVYWLQVCQQLGESTTPRPIETLSVDLLSFASFLCLSSFTFPTAPCSKPASSRIAMSSSIPEQFTGYAALDEVSLKSSVLIACCMRLSLPREARSC